MRYLVAFVVSYVGYVLLNFVVCYQIQLREFDLQYTLTSGFGVAVAATVAYALTVKDSNRSDKHDKE